VNVTETILKRKATEPLQIVDNAKSAFTWIVGALGIDEVIADLTLKREPVETHFYTSKEFQQANPEAHRAIASMALSIIELNQQQSE
jgi:hypothetical protein